MTIKGWVSVGTAGALLLTGIVLVAFTEERDIGVMLVLSALASAGVPAVRDSMPPPKRKGPPPVPPAGGSALLLVLLVLLVGGCGGATIVASEVVTSVCTDVADRIADRYEAGELAQDEARDQLGGARLVCEGIHGRLEDAAGAEEAE